MLDYTHWIWLSEALGPNTPASDLLFAHFGYDATAIYNADIDEYSKALPDKLHSKIRALTDKNLDEAKKIFDFCNKNGIGIIPACAKYYYPAQLRRIKNKPVVLYYRGKLSRIEDKLNIAMVGTRSITEYGRRLAYTVSYDLAKCGAVVVSGMALGIDGMSHNGALDAGGYTVAVLGCGVDRVYPREHTELMERIMQSGIVISEYKPFTPPTGYNFPARNRIISGLSQGCAVVEADVKSGALITARYAIEQGRRLFAVPGKADESSSAGTNRLIQEGAYMLTSAHDIIRHYSDTYANVLNLSAISTVKNRILRAPDSSQALAKSGSKAKSQPKPTETETEEKQTPAVSETTETKSEIPETIPARADDKGVIDIGISDENRDKNESDSSPADAMGEYEQQIYKRTSFTDPISSDELISEGLPISQVMIGLTKLEISGYIKTVSGGKFVRVK